MDHQQQEASYHNDFAEVFIVGAGPSGLMAAVLLAEYSIGFRIIDKRHVRMRAGISECA
jgi:2-polyprenyl-6-methoxyphenol hydroxylase-like FAD-dependent oxidoreductase